MFGPIRRDILLCPYDHNITKSACFCTWVHSFVYQTVYWCSSEKRLVYTHPKAPVSEHVKPRLHASLKKFHGRYLNSLVKCWICVTIVLSNTKDLITGVHDDCMICSFIWVIWSHLPILSLVGVFHPLCSISCYAYGVVVVVSIIIYTNRNRSHTDSAACLLISMKFIEISILESHIHKRKTVFIQSIRVSAYK